MEKTILKTSLTHLPDRFQYDLQEIKKLILKAIPKAEMVILFGSFARGNYVEDTTQVDGMTYEYTSDYDILVVKQRNVNLLGLTWQTLKSNIDARPTPIPTTLITHNIHYLNHKIKNRYYFFLDVIKEGIMLHDSGKYELAVPPEKLPSDKRLKKAKKYQEHYIKEGDEFYDDAQANIEKERYRKAAFYLHQAVEHYYAALSLVFTDYKPKTHDLEALRQRSITINEALREVFPLGTNEQKALFKLLRRAYTDARYDLTYKITADELKYLMERAMILQEITIKLTDEEIAGLQV